MKRLLILAIVCMVVSGCSSKTVTWNTLGDKTITTKTEAAALYEARASVIKAYYKSLDTPRVIATMTAPDGTVVAIHSQIMPPMPGIPQHQNQIIGPVADVLKFITGGVVVDRMVRGIVRGAGDVVVNGDGNTIDKSDRIASNSEAVTSIEKDNDKSVFTDASQHDSGWTDDNSDNSTADSGWVDDNSDNSTNDSGWVDDNSNNSTNDSGWVDSNDVDKSQTDSGWIDRNDINNSIDNTDQSINDSYSPITN